MPPAGNPTAAPDMRLPVPSPDPLRESLKRLGILYHVNHPLRPRLGQIDRREFVKVAGAAGAVLVVGGSAGCQPGAPLVSGSGPAPDPAERELALLALDEATSAGAAYADVRVSRHWNESVSTREQQITNVSKSDSYGIGVRALVGGSWGFSATRDVSRDAVAAAGREAAACSAPGFLDSGLKVITSTLPRPARRNRVALGLDSDSRTSPASTARCTSVETRARRGGVPRSFRSSAPTRDSPLTCG